jgi:NAD(P)-dependent dehydrogenase (short-subunit alcohol dehydrogenase family)
VRSNDYLTALFNLEGKSAFVTGASRGLAFAEAFVKAGASVILAGRKQKELELAGDSLRA